MTCLSLHRLLVLHLILLASVCVTAADINQSTQAETQQTRSVAVLQTDALFGFDSFDLSAGGLDYLRVQLGQLAQFSEILSIRVIGHTDSTGPADYNLLLSRHRARAVAIEIKTLFPATNIAISAAGESQPLVSNDSRDNRRKNRRVEIEVLAIGNQPLTNK